MTIRVTIEVPTTVKECVVWSTEPTLDMAGQSSSKTVECVNIPSGSTQTFHVYDKRILHIREIVNRDKTTS